MINMLPLRNLLKRGLVRIGLLKRREPPIVLNVLPVLDTRQFSTLANIRIAMTLSCNDCDTIPKVEGAGFISCTGNTYLQTMHNGIKVKAGGYDGWWMAAIIARLQGHHEPQEELLFHHLLKHVNHDSLIVELGSNWAYYSNWYLKSVPGSSAVCVEPDPELMELGRFNIALNNNKARFIQAYIGFEEKPATTHDTLLEPIVPHWNISTLSRAVEFAPIEMLHLDIQGAEFSFLESFFISDQQSKVRFIVISTHHEMISGSPTTHRDCIESLRKLGAVVLTERSIEESYSADGLIIASFNPADADMVLPKISRAPKALTDQFWEHMIP
jgi:FkbM family methyltransferase